MRKNKNRGYKKLRVWNIKENVENGQITFW